WPGPGRGRSWTAARRRRRQRRISWESPQTRSGLSNAGLDVRIPRRVPQLRLFQSEGEVLPLLLHLREAHLAEALGVRLAQSRSAVERLEVELEAPRVLPVLVVPEEVDDAPGLGVVDRDRVRIVELGLGHEEKLLERLGPPGGDRLLDQRQPPGVEPDLHLPALLVPGGGAEVVAVALVEPLRGAIEIVGEELVEGLVVEHELRVGI